MEIENTKYSKKLGDKIQLTDCNGKVIDTTFEEICDASTDVKENISNILNSNDRTVHVKSTITNENNQEITNENLIAMVKNNEVDALDVTFESTHTGIPINAALYTDESMAEDVSSFLQPFNKPLIKNHMRHTEPLGRIINANYDNSEFVEDSGTINATFRVTDKDAIAKFADGRYKTMSIGASCGKIVCNTCGKTILNNGKVKFCGHWRGESYNNQVCTWTMTALNYREGSVVNDPADPYAQVKNIKVVKTDKGVNNMNNSSNEQNYGQVDNILNGANGNNNPQPTAPKPNEPAKDENGNDNHDANGSNDNVVEQIKNELEQTKSELEQTKNSLETANNDLAVKDAKIESLTAEKIITDSKIKSCEETLLSLANMNKSLLIKNAVLLNPDLKAEDLQKQSAKQIGAIINSLEAAPIRTPQQVPNPGLAVDDKHNDSKGDTEDANSSKPVKTLKDYETVVQNLMLN